MKFPIHLHNAISMYTCVRYVKAILTMVMNVRNESRLSMSRNRFSDNNYSHDLPGVNLLIDHHCCYECGSSLNDFFVLIALASFVGTVLMLVIIAQHKFLLFKLCQVSHNNILVVKIRDEKRIEEEQAAKAQNWKLFVCYDDDDDEEGSNFLKDKIISELPSRSAITPNEPVDSLSIGDEHIDTILATESDEFIKSCVENLVPNPSKTEGENGCDMIACFTTFSNVLFEADYESDSSDYQPCSDEDFLEEIFSNPLFEEEIIPMKIDQHHFNAESDFIESMLNLDSSIIFSSLKIDSLLDEFAGELTLLKPIPPGIDETDCHPENEIRFFERLLYDNSSRRPPEEFVYENSDAEIESFSPSPIPNEDTDSFMEEIDLSFNSDDPMPPGLEEDDDDSERDILILEELPNNYSLSLTVNEPFRFDIPSFSHPPAKPPDGNTCFLNIKIMGDVSNQKVPITGLTITRVPNQEKSLDLLSHRGLKIFKLSAKCPMMIHGKNIPTLDVPLFYFYPLDQLKYGGNWVKLSDLKQALRGRHPMLISSLIFLFSS
nr:hypothetical protein [Tanacetum cinerariifolium]